MVALDIRMRMLGLEMDMVQFVPKVQRSCYHVEHILGLQGLAGWLKDIVAHQ